MKVLLALLLLVLAGCASPGPSDSPAVGRIDGSVVGPDINGYANVTVHLLDLQIADTTTQYGGFTFRNLPPGIYHLEVSVPGTTGAREVVAVNANEIERVILQVQPIQAQPQRNPVWSHIAATELAFPGATCKECSWTVEAADTLPHDVELAASWTGVSQQQPGHLQIDLLAGETLLGTLNAAGDGGVHTLLIAGAELPFPLEDFHVRVRFGGDVVPQLAFRMESSVRLLYT